MFHDIVTMVCSVAVFILLLAFLLNICRVIDRDSNTYLLLNAVGGLLASVCSYYLGVIPFVVLEGVWGGFALLALLYSLFRSWSGVRGLKGAVKH